MNMHTPELSRQHAAYKAIRDKLWNSPARVVVKPVAITPPVLTVRVSPLWQLVDLHFDWHVKCYHDVVRECLRRFANDGEGERQTVAVPMPAVVPRKPAREIAEEVLENYPGISWRDLKGNRRTRNVVLPRQIAMYQISMQREDMSLPAIGRMFGGRDHTTVLHAVRKITRMLDEGTLKFARHDSIDDFAE